MNRNHANAATSAVVALAMSGDREAFGQLVVEHSSSVRQFLRRLCRGDAAVADDLAQSTFEKAWRKRASFRGDGEVRSWLMQIAFNEFRQNLRKHPRSQTSVNLDESTEAEQLLSADDPRTEDLDRLLGELSETERAAMVLSYGHGYSHREIAEALAQPVGTVKSLIHRAKERIRQRFQISDPAGSNRNSAATTAPGVVAARSTTGEPACE